jgi:hypothetical protein
MQVVHEVCCGLDVHKKSVTACVLWAAAADRRESSGRLRESSWSWPIGCAPVE